MRLDPNRKPKSVKCLNCGKPAEYWGYCLEHYQQVSNEKDRKLREHARQCGRIGA